MSVEIDYKKYDLAVKTLSSYRNTLIKLADIVELYAEATRDSGGEIDPLKIEKAYIEALNGYQASFFSLVSRYIRLKLFNFNMGDPGDPMNLLILKCELDSTKMPPRKKYAKVKVGQQYKMMVSKSSPFTSEDLVISEKLVDLMNSMETRMNLDSYATSAPIYNSSESNFFKRSAKRAVKGGESIKSGASFLVQKASHFTRSVFSYIDASYYKEGSGQSVQDLVGSATRQAHLERERGINNYLPFEDETAVSETSQKKEAAINKRLREEDESVNKYFKTLDEKSTCGTEAGLSAYKLGVSGLFDGPSRGSSALS